MKRVFLIVMDSFGCGEAPDAAAFGDEGADTLRSVSGSPKYKAPNLNKLGICRIDGVRGLSSRFHPIGSYGRLTEQSAGKDTTIGHWELAGLVSPCPLPTFPEGFPKELMDLFEKETGYGYLCNRPYSGTEALKDFGEEHLRTKKLIVYTSADSVFQIAANEALVPIEELYDICRKARKILRGPWGVGRVIARPFVGESKDTFVRTANRRDFSLLPPSATLLDDVVRAGLEVKAVGKITDIFAAQGITDTRLTHSNREGMKVTSEIAEEDFCGLCFVNLVEYDSLYGHRRDVDGYALAVNRLDRWLTSFMKKLGPDDVLVITADHGCDPAFLKTTDHTREYVPLLVYSPAYASVNLGTRSSFADVAASVAQWLNIEYRGAGHSFIDLLEEKE